MAKKRKNIPVLSRSGSEATIMPKYNPFQTGHGVMRSAKYPGRSARKAEARRQIIREDW